jgi:hypothetical protein
MMIQAADIRQSMGVGAADDLTKGRLTPRKLQARDERNPSLAIAGENLLRNPDFRRDETNTIQVFHFVRTSSLLAKSSNLLNCGESTPYVF